MSQLLELEPVLVRKLSSRSTSRPAARPTRRERDPEPVGLLEPPILEAATAAPALALDAPLVAPLRRPEARPRPKPRVPALKPRPALIKAATLTVAGVALLCCTGRIAAFAMAPVIQSYRTGADIKTMELRIADAKRANAELARQVSFLGTGTGKEEEARRRGYLRPHEIGIQFVLPEHMAAAAPAAAAGPVRARVSISERIRNAVDTCLANLGGGNARR